MAWPLSLVETFWRLTNIDQHLFVGDATFDVVANLSPKTHG